MATAVRRRPGWVVVPATVAAVGFALAVTALRGSVELRRVREAQERLREAVATLRAESDRLEAEVTRLRDDPEALRFEAKATLDLVAPGETVVLLRYPESTGPHPPPEFERRETAAPASEDADAPPQGFPDPPPDPPESRGSGRDPG